MTTKKKKIIQYIYYVYIILYYIDIRELKLYKHGIMKITSYTYIIYIFLSAKTKTKK